MMKTMLIEIRKKLAVTMCIVDSTLRVATTPYTEHYQTVELK
jgi:hypothetical protein